MSKTFREVIRDIKPNETYKSNTDVIIIKCTEDGSIIIPTPYRELEIKPSYEFKKLRDKVSFDVAFKEYLNGKEIESVYSGDKYKIISKTNSKEKCFSQKWQPNSNIDIDDIKNSWYIND